jgi:hypothetical protein
VQRRTGGPGQGMSAWGRADNGGGRRLGAVREVNSAAADGASDGVEHCSRVLGLRVHRPPSCQSLGDGGERRNGRIHCDVTLQEGPRELRREPLPGPEACRRRGAAS